MATTNSANNNMHFATSTSAETWAALTPVKQVRVTNQGTTAGDDLYVTLATGRTAAEAEGKIVEAAADADETFIVLPGETKVIFKSPRATYVAGSIEAGANTPAASIECTDWYE